MCKQVWVLSGLSGCVRIIVKVTYWKSSFKAHKASMTSEPKGEHSAALLTPITSHCLLCCQVQSFQYTGQLHKTCGTVRKLIVFVSAVVWACRVLHINEFLWGGSCPNSEWLQERRGMHTAWLHFTLLSHSLPPTTALRLAKLIWESSVTGGTPCGPNPSGSYKLHVQAKIVAKQL